MKKIEFRAMGSRMLALVDSNSGEADEILNRLPAWFEEWEQSLSRFRPGNELDRLNHSDGRPMAVSQTLWDVFQAACNAEKFTSGLVTPTVLDALVSAGYDRSFESLPVFQLSQRHWGGQIDPSFAAPAWADPSGVHRLGCSHPQPDPAWPGPP